MVGFEIAVRKASKYYTLADFACMGLFINDVIIFGEYPRFSLQNTLNT